MIGTDVRRHCLEARFFVHQQKNLIGDWIGGRNGLSGLEHLLVHVEE
jgi:hypothetical protein